MNFQAFWSDEKLLWEALLISLIVHYILIHAGGFSLHLYERHPVEIDITNMGHSSQHDKNAASPKPAARQKEWTKPAHHQKVIPAPIPVKPVPPVPEENPPAPSEYGVGTGEKNADALSRLPQLLNLSDLNSILKRFYPEEARTQRKEGAVTLDLHIDTEGIVHSADIVRSGGIDFDQAAIKVAKLLRFTPAFIGNQRVAVKLRQTIQFKLEEE